MRKNDPESRIQLQWDKLYINNEVYIYCEETGCVEHEVADSIINNVGLSSNKCEVFRKNASWNNMSI